MTISSSTASASYTGNGSTQIFPVPFYFLVDTDVKVSQKVAATGVISVLTLNSGYTLTGAGNQAGGSATFVTAPASGDAIFIERNVDAVQETAYPENGIFPAASHEKALDRLTMLVQQLQTADQFTLTRDPLGDSYDMGGNRLTNVADAVDAQDVPSLHQVQELVVEGAVAGLSGDTGSSLVGFKQAGVGAVSRTVQDKARESVSVKDFGAKGDGSTDDTAAIQAAITYCSGTGVPRRLYFPAGTYIVTSGFTITHPVRFIGDGNGYYAWGGAFTADQCTTIKYNGAAGAVVFSLTDVNFGASGFENIAVDCNSLANGGVLYDGVVGSRNENLAVRGFKVYGIKLTGTNDTCSWNTFINTQLETSGATSGTKGALWLSGVTGSGNACHNTFTTTQINIAGSFHGVYLGGCDNCTMHMTYVYRGAGGTGHGVHVDPTEMTNFPVNNTFYHLQASVGGWFQPATTINRPASIYGYMQDNGQPIPTLSVNGSWLLDCADVVYPLTVTTGTGWSGGTPNIDAWYRVHGHSIFLTIYIHGTGIVAAANATLNGVPSTNSNAHGVALGYGANFGGSGSALSAYISGATVTINSGITTTNSAQLTFVYEI